MISKTAKILHEHLDQKWLLVAEPSKNYKASIKSFLANLKVEKIKFAGSATEVHREMLTTPVGFFVLAWDLSGDKNGLQLCRELRKLNQHTQTPILLLSAENMRQDVVLASEVGIDGYLLKPFSYEDFSSAIDHIVMNRESPSPVNQLLNEAFSQLARGQIAAAGDLFTNALRDFPTSARAQCGLAATIYLKGDKNDAIELYRQAIETNPHYIDAYRELMEILMALKRTDDLYSLAKMVNTLSPGNPRYTMLVAKASLDLGNLEESESFFRQTIRLSPRLAEAYKGLGNIEFIKEDYISAMKHFKKALDLEKGDIGVLNSLGLTYVKMGKIKEGIDRYRAALKISPHEPKVLFNLGYAKEKLGDVEDALFYYKCALEYDPDFSKAARRLEVLTKKPAS